MYKKVRTFVDAKENLYTITYSQVIRTFVDTNENLCSITAVI